MIRFADFDPSHIPAAVELWNAACGPGLAITERGFRYNTLPSTGTHQAGRVAWVGDDLAGFVLASEFSAGDPNVSSPETGWIDAIAVGPAHQGHGTGGQLLDWAEGWLAARGCRVVRLGASLRPFAPGLPSELPADFFRGRGYAGRPHNPVVWDVARDMRDYTSPATIRPEQAQQARAATPADRAALDDFFRRAFPGRWAYEAREYLGRNGSITDFTVLEVDGRIDGFAWLTFPDSARSLERCFPNGLPRPWGHLGPIGISAGLRGGGWGGAILDAGLRRLRDAGIAGCVIDWTDLLDFYGKFGFKPFRSYEMLAKGGA